MTATTKRILSELQHIDSGAALQLRLSPEIYSPAALKIARRLIEDPAELRPLDDDLWELAAHRAGEVLSGLIVLTVRDLR